MGNYVLSERAARALTPLIRGKAASSSPGYASAAVSLDAFPPPFTVRWSQSENSGDGAWVIWLPDLAKLVQLDAAYLTLEGVTAATKLPTGWYTIDDDDGEATEVYCNVHKPTGSGSPSANISVDADTATTGESVIPVLAARMVTTESGAKLVKQFVDSALILAGGGGDQVTPDDVSTEFCPHDDAPGADNTHEGELQIKGWNNGTPRAAYDLAATLQQTNPASPDEKPCVVVRNKDGTLNYMIVGDMSNVMLLDVDQTVNSDKTWATSKGVEFNGKYFLSSSIASPDSVVRIEANDNNAILATAKLSIGPLDYIVEFLKICGVGSSSMAPRLVVGGTTSDPIVNAFAVLGYDLATNPDSSSVDFSDPKHGRLITSAKWVRDYFVRKSGIAALNGLQVLTGWEFDTSTHKINVKTKTLSVADGVISVGQEATTQIDTTPISSIVS